MPRLMSRVRIPSPAPITTTPSYSGGCCCICDIDGGFELSGKRVRLQARNGRSMSVSRQASERRDFVFSVRRAGVAGFIFAVGRAGVAGFVLPAMRVKYRGISIVQLLTFLTSFHSGGCCCNCDSGKDNRRLFRYIDTKCVRPWLWCCFHPEKALFMALCKGKTELRPEMRKEATDERPEAAGKRVFYPDHGKKKGLRRDVNDICSSCRCVFWLQPAKIRCGNRRSQC